RELRRGLGDVVTVDGVGAGDVVADAALRIERGGQRVEGEFLDPVAPHRVAGDPGEDLVARHVLHDPARLEALARVAEARTRVLVAGETTAGELPVGGLDGVVVAVGGRPV